MFLLEYDLFGCPIVTHFGFCSSGLDLGSLSLCFIVPPLLGVLLALPSKARILCLDSL